MKDIAWILVAAALLGGAPSHAAEPANALNQLFRSAGIDPGAPVRSGTYRSEPDFDSIDEMVQFSGIFTDNMERAHYGIDRIRLQTDGVRFLFEVEYRAAPGYAFQPLGHREFGPFETIEQGRQALPVWIGRNAGKALACSPR